MAIALKAQSRQVIKPLGQRLMVGWLKVVLYRIWWHTHVYTVIFGILLMTLVSLVFLFISSYLSKFLEGSRHWLFASDSWQPTLARSRS